MRFCLLFLLVLGAACAAGPAWALTCPDPGQPRIVFSNIQDAIQYDFGQNRAALNQMGSQILASRNTFGSNSYVGGLTNGTISSDMSTELQTLTSTDGQACVWVSSINIRLHYHPVVYVSREFVQGSCYHAAVLEHEHKHVAVDYNLMNEYGPAMQQGIQNIAMVQGHLGPFPAGQMQVAGQNINAAMEAAMNAVMNNISAARQARQAQIDVPQEYARVQALCRNWP